MFGWLKRNAKTEIPTDQRGSNYDPVFSPLIHTIDEEMRENKELSYYDLKWTDSETFKALKARSDDDRALLCDWLVTEICETIQQGEKTKARDIWPKPHDWGHNPACRTFIGLMRSKQDLPVDMVLRWFDTIDEIDTRYDGIYLLKLDNWPCSYMVQQIERRAKTHPLTELQIEHLKLIAERPPMGEKADYYGSDLAKVKTRIEKLIGGTDETNIAARPYKKLSGDNFGNPLEAELKKAPSEQQDIWNTLFNHAAAANGARPSKTFGEETARLSEQFGKENLRKLLQDWLRRAVDAQIESEYHRNEFNGQVYEYTDQTYLTANNIVLVKGLVWMCAAFRDATTIRLIADLCEKCMKKIPGQGPAAQATANACL